MAGKYLGPAFDIHGGGVDLRFPHHENEQAQSRAAGHPFASYWLHNAWITTAGEKMSKSLGNSLLIPEVLKRVRGIELRFYIVAAHYRSHVEFSFEALDEAAAGFRRIEGFLRAGAARPTGAPASCAATALPRAFVAAMDDDLGTPAATAVVYDAVREGNRLLAAGDDAGAAAGGRAGRARCSACSGLDPADPALGPRHRRRGRAADRGRRRAGAGPARASGPRPARPRTSPPPTRSATGIKAAGIEIEDTPTGPKWSL